MNKYALIEHYNSLEYKEINRLVAEAEGMKYLGKGWIDNADGVYDVVELDGGYRNSLPDYCNNPSDAFPIMLKYGVSLHIDDEVFAYKGVEFDYEGAICNYNFICDITNHKDKNILRAAMIVFLLMKEAEKEFVAAQEPL